MPVAEAANAHASMIAAPARPAIVAFRRDTTRIIGHAGAGTRPIDDVVAKTSSFAE